MERMIRWEFLPALARGQAQAQSLAEATRRNRKLSSVRAKVEHSPGGEAAAVWLHEGALQMVNENTTQVFALLPWRTCISAKEIALLQQQSVLKGQNRVIKMAQTIPGGWRCENKNRKLARDCCLRDAKLRCRKLAGLLQRFLGTIEKALHEL